MGIKIYIITLLLSALSFFISLSTNMFGLFENPISVQLGSFSITFLIILFGDRIASSEREKSFQRKFSNLTSNIPTINVIKQFRDCNEALEYIISRMTHANLILNTKISKRHIYSESDVDLYDKYTNAIKDSLQNKLVFKDIVSEVFKDYSKHLEDYSKRCNGRYQYQTIKSTAPSFLNFIILSYGDDKEEELVFGWASSFYMGSEQKAFLIRDNRVIEYFRQYHQTLFPVSE